MLLLPLLLLLTVKQKYRKSLPARFFGCQKPPSNGVEIWLHACSFGEVRSLEPIIKSLLSKEKKLLLTTTTQTGHDLGQKTFGMEPNFEVRYLPFELFVWRWKPALKQLKSFVVTESELWYMPFFLAKTLGAKTLLINARISDRSYDKYLKLRAYYKEVFERIDRVFAQSKNDVLRLESLGAKNIKICGNLKIYSKIEITKLYHKPKKFVVVAASSHPEEEELVLSVFARFLHAYPQSLLILAPRHPERFDEVYKMLEGFRVSRLSDGGINEEMDVVLVDILGELNNIYRIADLVILCGSFVEVGGHNPLEPAFFGTRLISGPYIFNQYVLFDYIEGYEIAQNASELQDKMLNFEKLPHARIKAEQCGLDALIEEIL